MSETESVPRGCECTDCNAMNACTGSNAPVAFLIDRDGDELRVCTRCDLSSDTRLEIIPTAETPLEPYMNYDALGAIVLANELADGDTDD